ncbi:MAG: hypothetical protein PHR16_16235 [Methylovulum sp.]|nr:hypothetical protein [Methylovulum sp.]
MPKAPTHMKQRLRKESSIKYPALTMPVFIFFIVPFYLQAVIDTKRFYPNLPERIFGFYQNFMHHFVAKPPKNCAKFLQSR